MFISVSDGEHSLKVKPTNLEKKAQNGENKKLPNSDFTASPASRGSCVN